MFFLNGIYLRRGSCGCFLQVLVKFAFRVRLLCFVALVFVWFLLFWVIFSPASRSHAVPMCLLRRLLPFPIRPFPPTYCLIFRQATAVLKYFQNFPYAHVHTHPRTLLGTRVFVRGRVTSSIAAGCSNGPPDLIPPPIAGFWSWGSCCIPLDDADVRGRVGAMQGELWVCCRICAFGRTDRHGSPALNRSGDRGRELCSPERKLLEGENLKFRTPCADVKFESKAQAPLALSYFNFSSAAVAVCHLSEWVWRLFSRRGGELFTPGASKEET